jgi:hypothetical protein
MNDPSPAVLAALLGIAVLGIWLLWRFAPRPGPRPAVSEAPRRWTVHCDQCGDLDPPVPSADDALDVGLLHLELNFGHVLSLGPRTEAKEAS